MKCEKLLNKLNFESLNIYSSLSSIFFLVRLQWYQAKQAIPDFSVSCNAFQLLLRDPKAFPVQMKYKMPPASSGSPPTVHFNSCITADATPMVSLRNNIQTQTPLLGAATHPQPRENNPPFSGRQRWP